MRREGVRHGNGRLHSSLGGEAGREEDEASHNTSPSSAETPDHEGAAVLPGGDSLDRYMRDIKLWPLLSAKDEKTLALRTSCGDPAALEEMVSRNLRLVVYWAKRYRASGLSIEDLIQEGNIGLMRAAAKFNPCKGTRFSTYASWWIRQAIYRAICDRQDLIRIPVHMHHKMRLVDRMLESTGALESRDVDVEETVEEMGIIPFKEWTRARRLQQPVTLDHRPDPDRGGSIEVEDQRAENPVRVVYLREIREHVARLLRELPPRYRTVLKLRYGLGGEDQQTLESIAARLRISRERVRQIQGEAIERLAVCSGMTGSAGSEIRDPGRLRLRLEVNLKRALRIKTDAIRAAGGKSSPFINRSGLTPGSNRRRGSL